jgi:hypothetical protein
MGAYDLGFVHPTGYPLYLLIGHLFSRLPVGEVGFRLNLASAVFASLANGVLYLLIQRQTRSSWNSLVATALFATIPIYWSQSIRAEVYSLHMFLMLCAMYAWYKAYRECNLRSYVLVFIFLGLGVANHLTSILLWAAALVSSYWLDRRLRSATLPASLLGLLLGGVFYLYFPWRAQADLQIDYIRPYFNVDPGQLSGIWWMISGQAFRCLLVPPQGIEGVLREIARLAGDMVRGTLGVGLVLSLPGWAALGKSSRDWNRLLSLYFVANLVMYLGYGAIDKEVMFIPIYAALCIWFASGITVLVGWIASARTDLRLERINMLVSAAFLALILVGMFFDWRSVSLRGDLRTYAFANQVLEQAGPSTTIVSHWATASVIDYLLVVEGKRPDIDNYNADFYYLGIQESCRPVTEQQLLENGWIAWLADLSVQERLCFIEPLHGVPEGYRWQNRGLCWALIEDPPAR